MASTSFIEDLPSGPLDLYRKQASFDWKQLRLLSEGEDILKTKMQVWKALENDPLFQKPDYEPSTQEQKRIATIRVQRFRNYDFIPKTGQTSSIRKRARYLMSINEALSVGYPDVSVKQGLGIFLFQNTLATLGTERHQHLIEAVWNGQMLSALALTEVAHGSDAKNMKTTATYDKNTQEFIINTPDFKAAKCWVGNLGKTCTAALLFAQLHTSGQCHGLHAFVVPIRDPKTLLPYPGIIVGDVGEKAGLNGIDNGFIMFQHYRIPRENLLNRTADVTPEGDYESSFSDPGRILGAALENLSAGRVAIMQECTNNLITGITIAIRYAALRTQFGPHNGKELPIIEYQLHQWRLFPYVSAASVLKICVTSIADDYLKAVEMSHTDAAIENLGLMVSEIHAIISALKPLISWTSLQAIQECREACGGHGYLKASRLGDLRNTVDPCVSYEGDNNVLGQQTSNWILRQYANALKGEVVQSPLQMCSFLKDYKEILPKRFKGRTIQDVTDIKFLQDAYVWLITYLTDITYKKQMYLLSQNECKFTARCNIQVYKAAVLSRVYGEYIALTYYWKRINCNDVTENLQPTLNLMGMLYGLSCLDKHLVYLYQGNYASPNLSELVKEAVLSLCGQLKPEVVSVVDALAPPDFLLSSMLGNSDGKLYEHIQAEFFNNNGAMSRPSWWREIKVDDVPDLKIRSKL